MSTHGCVFSSSTESLMQFLLSINKSFICFFSKIDISEDCTCDEWSDTAYLDINICTDGSTVIDVVGYVNTTFGVYIC